MGMQFLLVQTSQLMTEVFWSCGWFLVAVCGGLVGWLCQALFIHRMGQKVAGTVVFSPRITRQECPGILGYQKFARVGGVCENGPPSPRASFVCFYPMLMGGNNFFGNFFTPLMYVQNDQRVMGIILRYVCWSTHRPPTPP